MASEHTDVPSVISTVGKSGANRKEATEVTRDKRIKKRKGHIKSNVRTGGLG